MNHDEIAMVVGDRLNLTIDDQVWGLYEATREVTVKVSQLQDICEATKDNYPMRNFIIGNLFGLRIVRANGQKAA